MVVIATAIILFLPPLAIAYIISVANYLNLFGAFGMSLLSNTEARQARELTSCARS